MRILITNDDAMYASQLVPLVRACRALGEVDVVVPEFEQSGKSHGIELHKAFRVTEHVLAPDVTATAVDSTPADCVRFAILGRKKKYDLVISGINRGFNIGSDIMYSGTVAAAMEAGALGVKAVALSTSPEYYAGAVDHVQQVFDYLRENDLLSIHGIYNINIPPQPKGFRITRQGGPYYSDDFRNTEGDWYMPCGKCVYEDRGDMKLDTDAVIRGWISIMPLTVSRADIFMYEKLQYLNGDL